MADTRTLKIALVALAFLAALLIFDIASQATERGFTTIAGDTKSSRTRLKGPKFRKSQRKRSFHDTIFVLDGSRLIEESLANSEERRIRRQSHLRNKVSYMRRRARSKIIKVSPAMKRLGEERAARREAKMLANIENLDIRYYRDNEAYDARYPSIVYLETLKK